MTKHEAFLKAYAEYPSQDNEGYIPSREGFKAGFSAVKGVKPGFIKQAVEDLLPEFASALDPVYQDAKSQSKPVAGFFVDHAGRVADALLAITDGKAQRSKSSVVKGTYDKLRGSAKKNVEAAVPRLGKLVEKHAG
jgi:hypothetical protein